MSTEALYVFLLPNRCSHAEFYIGDSVSALGVSIAQHELLRISQQGSQCLLRYYKGALEQQSQLLETTVGLMKLLDSNELLRGACQLTLWHTDLYMGNI
jgi:hypothetical protein